ncbi:MAG: DUF1573 domain-containing protein [Rikenellaceae bacterium]
MRLSKGVICLIVCLLSANFARSQEFEFDSLSFDFGTIAEDGGSVSHTFSLKNAGSQPAVIVFANSSCGCTTPEYSRAPIAPGASSTVAVTFDPMNRPGDFSKTIQIVVAPDNRKYTLTITGDVTPRKKSTEELYPFDLGEGFRVGANYFPLSHIGQGERVETQVTYINSSKKAIKVTLQPITESGKFDIKREFTVAAGAKGTLAAAYDLSSGGTFYGPLADKYIVKVNGKEAKYQLMFNGHAIDRFTAESRATPPIGNLSSRMIRLGSIKRGKESEKTMLTIENTGVSDLIIRDVSLADGVKSTLKSGTTIEPSGQIAAEVWIDSSGADYGNFSRYITLTLNDPDGPLQRIRVVGTIEN